MSVNTATGVVDAFTDDRDLRTLSAYLGALTVSSAVWIAIVALLTPSPKTAPGQVDSIPLATVFAIVVGCVGPALPAYTIHQLAPTPVDRFHELGVTFAMFAATNLILSVAFLAAAFSQPMAVMHGWFIAIAEPVIVSSLFLPGPYVGLVVARRWSR